MRDVIPAPLFESIQAHLEHGSQRAAARWEAGSEEEDTLTGHLGACLEREWTPPIVVGGKQWRWRIRYKKFRGRGRGAFEAISGADGIVQVEVLHDTSGISANKGVMFQAKKVVIGRDHRLIAQVERMEEMAPGSSAVFEYSGNGYRGLDGRTYLQEARERRSFGGQERQSLGSFLGSEFLPCNAGLRGLYYDGVRGLLLLPTGAAIRIDLGHRFSIEVGRL